jgi:XTP/dITP diphosphohydrolase
VTEPPTPNTSVEPPTSVELVETPTPAEPPTPVELVETPRVFLASRNAKKIEEMRRILDEHLPGIRVLGLDDVAAYDEPVEDQPTFEGNALLKARAGVSATGLPSLADDSGLCVDALNGMPGVLSARWSGPPKDDHRNNTLLLAQLADVPDERRGAQFRCAVAFCDPTGAQKVTPGTMPGRVIRELRGSGGFGYDVLFVPDEQDGDLTAAELPAGAKDQISHRGHALRTIAPVVAHLLKLSGSGSSQQ